MKPTTDDVIKWARDAWKYNRVDEAIREALAKAKEQT